MSAYSIAAAQITPVVNVNSRYIVASIEVGGNDEFKLSQDIQELTEEYKDKGYAYVNIIPQTPVDEPSRIIDVIFEIQKGSEVTVSTSPRAASTPAAALTAFCTLCCSAGLGLLGSSSSMTEILRRFTAPGARTTFWTDLFSS